MSRNFKKGSFFFSKKKIITFCQKTKSRPNGNQTIFVVCYGTDLLDSDSKPDHDGDGYDYMLEQYYNSSDQDANQIPDLELEITINDGYAYVSFENCFCLNCLPNL